MEIRMQLKIVHGLLTDCIKCTLWIAIERQETAYKEEIDCNILSPTAPKPCKTETLNSSILTLIYHLKPLKFPFPLTTYRYFRYIPTKIQHGWHDLETDILI